MTVSRVLNYSSAVKPATRERVQSAIDELNYRPNVMARSLARRQSLLIGLLYHNASSAYLSELLVSTLKYSRELGHHLMIEDLPETDDGTFDSDLIISRLQNLGLDGIILPPLLSRNEGLVGVLSELNSRLVVLGQLEGAPQIARVSFDDRGSARAMTRYLIDRGHRRIGFVSGLKDCLAGKARKMGFDLALTDHDIPLNPDLCVEGDYTLRSGVRAAEKLLNMDEPPSAIFCCNDDMAAGVLVAAHRRGMSVPKDISVTGFDDTYISSITWPGFTTIRQPIAQMAELAMTFMSGGEFPEDDDITRLSDKHVQVNTVEIIERDSVADLT